MVKGLREDLIFVLKLLSDEQKQHEIWDKGKEPKVPWETFNFMLHIIFDDTALGDDAFSTIGGILEDENEARAIEKLTGLMRDVLQTPRGLGYLDPYEYINNPKWSKVVEAAQAALKLIK